MRELVTHQLPMVINFTLLPAYYRIVTSGIMFYSTLESYGWENHALVETLLDS